MHAPLTKEVVGSGCHTTFTCSVTQVASERVATQGPYGDVGCERLDSVTTRLAKRTGDTSHLGGDSIPTLTHTSGDSVTSDYDVEALWPSGVALSVYEIDDDKTGTSAPFLRDKTCRNDIGTLFCPGVTIHHFRRISTQRITANSIQRLFQS